MTRPDNYVLEGGASNQVVASLIRIFSWNQASISYVNSSIDLNINQSANVNLKPRKRCVFWIYVKVVILFVRNLFRVRLPYLLLIYSPDSFKWGRHNIFSLCCKRFDNLFPRPAAFADVWQSANEARLTFSKH
jgi:hypothetical protein